MSEQNRPWPSGLETRNVASACQSFVDVVLGRHLTSDDQSYPALRCYQAILDAARAGKLSCDLSSLGLAVEAAKYCQYLLTSRGFVVHMDDDAFTVGWS